MHFWCCVLQTAHTENNTKGNIERTKQPIMTYETRYQKKASQDREREEQPRHRKKVTQPRTHPSGWTKENHYGVCGQNCPCCRRQVGDKLGVCPIC